MDTRQNIWQETKLKRYMYPYLLLLIFLGYGLPPSFAQEGYPKPHAKNLLFYIQHNRGKNTYIYQTNIDQSGKLDRSEPVKISRQLFDNKGEIKPLTTIQRKFAYGVDWNAKSDNSYELTLVSYPEQRLYLRSTDDQKYVVETTLNGIKMKVHRLFIFQKEGTSGLNTKVDYILFFGTNQDGKQIQSKLIVD